MQMPTVVKGDFEWDIDKARLNEKKHGVSFDEALTAFGDEHQLTLEDPQGHADRFVLVGMSDKARVLFVVHAEITKRRTRIISARIASKKQAVQYALGDAL